jgi:hypothetical protein
MAVAIKDLDRLVSKTDLTPVSKQALREVRKAVISHRAGDAIVGETEWKIEIETRGGSTARFRFSMKKVN